MSKRILIVEDEVDLAAAIVYRLEQEGFKAQAVHAGMDALAVAAAEPPPDFVILDLMLPDISGREVCRRLRQDAATASIPILMLTALGDEVDRVVGFELGADDYLVKPCSLRELTLRLRAILKRTGDNTSQSTDRIVFGSLTVDSASHRVWVTGEERVLTALEFRLLTTFLERKGRVQSRDQLLNDVWGYDAMVTTRTVDTHVKRLREKLGDASGYIETLRGVGYRFCSNPDGGEA